MPAYRFEASPCCPSKTYSVIWITAGATISYLLRRIDRKEAPSGMNEDDSPSGVLNPINTDMVIMNGNRCAFE